MAAGFIDPNSPLAQAIAEEMLQRGDLGTEEELLQRQMAQAEQLRTRPQPARMDWASQAARGISGIASGYQMGKAMEGQKALGGKYTDMMRSVDTRRRIPRGMGFFEGEDQVYG